MKEKPTKKEETLETQNAQNCIFLVESKIHKKMEVYQFATSMVSTKAGTSERKNLKRCRQWLQKRRHRRERALSDADGSYKSNDAGERSLSYAYGGYKSGNTEERAMMTLKSYPRCQQWKGNTGERERD